MGLWVADGLFCVFGVLLLLYFRLIVLVALYWFRLCGCFSFCCGFGYAALVVLVFLGMFLLLYGGCLLWFVGLLLDFDCGCFGFGDFLFVFWLGILVCLLILSLWTGYRFGLVFCCLIWVCFGLLDSLTGILVCYA